MVGVWCALDGWCKTAGWDEDVACCLAFGEQGEGRSERGGKSEWCVAVCLSVRRPSFCRYCHLGSTSVARHLEKNSEGEAQGGTCDVWWASDGDGGSGTGPKEVPRYFKVRKSE